jgi:hypothetical protein
LVHGVILSYGGAPGVYATYNGLKKIKILLEASEYTGLEIKTPWISTKSEKL